MIARTFLFLTCITFIRSEHDSCSDNNASCLIQSTQEDTITSTATSTTTSLARVNNHISISKGSVLIGPSGLQWELITKIGLLAENECLPIVGPSSEIALRPVVPEITKQGLLLAPIDYDGTGSEQRLRIAAPATYFTGLEIATLTPTVLTRRVEEEEEYEKEDERFTNGKHWYKINEQYDKGSCGEVWRAKLKQRNGGGEF